MARKIALGRGMASLIQDTPNQILARSLVGGEEGPDGGEEGGGREGASVMVPIEEVRPNPKQPRKTFPEKDLEELSLSIRESGVLVPLIVAGAPGGYELIAGERRLKAAARAGLTRVPVVVRRGTEREKMVMSIVENIQRSDLNCVEEALAYSALMDEFHLTQEEVAKSLGKERSSIANHLRILGLPREVIDLLRDGALSFGHAKVLAALKEPDRALGLARAAAARGMSVRELEAALKADGRRRGGGPPPGPPPGGALGGRLPYFRDRLEERTGLHVRIQEEGGGSGRVVLKFSDKEGFDAIYEFLMGGGRAG